MNTVIDFAITSTSEFQYEGFANIRHFMLEVCDHAVVTHDMETEVVKPQYKKIKHVNWTEEGFEAAYASKFGEPKRELPTTKKTVGKAVKRSRVINVNFTADTKF